MLFASQRGATFVRRCLPDALDAVRGRGRWTGRPVGVARLAVIVTGGGSLYGLGMGTFDLSTPERYLLPFYAAVKVPLLLLASFAICLPAFYVLNSAAGLRRDFGRALDAVMAAQAGLAIALASLTPITLFLYVCGVDHRRALLASAGMFLLATLAGQAVMAARYTPLIKASRAHAVLLGVWVMMYAFVGIQGGWILRPFVGTPGKPVTFFREDALTNAYIAVLKIAFAPGYGV